MRDGKLHKKLVVVIEAGLKAFDFGSEVRVRKQLGGLCGKFEASVCSSLRRCGVFVLK